jgi:hypothetical protein
MVNGGAASFLSFLRWARSNAAWLWPAVFVGVSLLYTVFVVRPFSTTGPGEQTAGVAASWNESISQLGISPLYPPQEDFFVGDLWAVIVGGPEKPLLGKAVRVGHIDLKTEISKSHDNRIQIDYLERDASPPASAVQKADSGDAGLVHLSSIAFPGITVSHILKNGSGPSFAGLYLSSSRTGEKYDDVKIPEAKTYGVEPIDGLLKLYSYCDDKDTSVRCTGTFIRNIIAALLDVRAIQSNGDKPDIEIRLELITRVYLTKVITHRKVMSGKTYAIAGEGQPSDAPKSDSTVHDKTSGAELLSHVGADTTEISFSETFSKPLVFGYRSLTFIPK